MSRVAMKVSLSPKQAADMIVDQLDASLVHQESHQVGDQSITTLVFEKYFMRVKNRVALIIILEDFKGETGLRVISTGSSEGMFINFDWGAANSFVGSVERILADYIREKTELADL
ncbi:DUF6054 family protein [Geosporobacter ferrireducens]|uniref:Uncharacterized protein n=1 Tax=Geosporobacter ferrireducens TaxID=1424294 RepID=A0A1D8GJ06_9FIRM|nr:DUF6054 family protein [Geosporobacter ferrireducens]AOT70888.1 hypothetical protein Gferi_15775 [Geosporobacter ferrireducens]MTI53594.1 hypothetical protein [Geosporobacter ferrireducens]